MSLLPCDSMLLFLMYNGNNQNTMRQIREKKREGGQEREGKKREKEKPQRFVLMLHQMLPALLERNFKISSLQKKKNLHPMALDGSLLSYLPQLVSDGQSEFGGSLSMGKERQSNLFTG